MFRDYKRHYHKVKEVESRLADDGGSFNLQIKFEGNRLSAQNTTPNEEHTVRFVVLMRRFLSPSDSLYYRNVWSLLKENFSEELPEGAIESIESFIERMNQGYVAIKNNGIDLAAEKIYQTLSSGGYFDDNEEAESYLRTIMSVPIGESLSWYQFYNYNLTGFSLASKLLRDKCKQLGVT